MDDPALLSLAITPPEGRAGAKTTVAVSCGMTIQDLKTLVCAQIKVRPNNTVLCYNDGYLELDATVEDYDIPNGATLVYHVRLCGPLPVDTDWSLVGFTKLQKVGRKRGI